RMKNQVHFFERTTAGAYRAPVSIHNLSDPTVREKLSDDVYLRVVDELEMLDAAGASFDKEAVLSGKLTPVFFGSAVNNFGVQLLLDAFLEHSTPPRPRVAGAMPINPDDSNFSGFVFKIQANMDTRHRDRIAIVRVCSGKFTRDMPVTHVQSGKRVRLSSSHKLFGQERETIDEAYAGDVIGLVGHAGCGIGDTLTDSPAVVFDEIPRFAPECFAYLHATATSQYKRFKEGLDQLLQEGVVQQFQIKDSNQRAPLLAAVGPLQFEVVQYRLQSEYGAESRLESASWELLRWVSPETPADALRELALPSGAKLAHDAKDQPAILFPSEWSLRYFEKQHPAVRLADVPFKKDAEALRSAAVAD
ncbi:MAG: pfrC, partial [Phycisphaerales bacterium]|nr:pfrC [Phycisphaerales bacterium]